MDETNIPKAVSEAETTVEIESQITELKPEKTKMDEFLEFLRDIVIIFVVVIAIRTFIAAPFQIR